jgi:hypothetical protein
MYIIKENSLLLMEKPLFWKLTIDQNWKNTRVQYSNPFDEDREYLAICLPAFSSGFW